MSCRGLIRFLAPTGHLTAIGNLSAQGSSPLQTPDNTHAGKHDCNKYLVTHWNPSTRTRGFKQEGGVPSPVEQKEKAETREMVLQLSILSALTEDLRSVSSVHIGQLLGIPQLWPQGHLYSCACTCTYTHH